jgi:hypothetical protein
VTIGQVFGCPPVARALMSPLNGVQDYKVFEKSNDAIERFDQETL